MCRVAPIICAAEKHEMVTPSWLGERPSFCIMSGSVASVTPTPSICTKTASQIGSSALVSGDDVDGDESDETAHKCGDHVRGLEAGRSRSW